MPATRAKRKAAPARAIPHQDDEDKEEISRALRAGTDAASATAWWCDDPRRCMSG